MQIGKLRHYIDLQSNTGVKNEYGELEFLKENWSTFASVWASIEPLSGRELLQYQQMNAEMTHKITIRYNSSIDSKCRIVFGTRIFSIAGPPKNIEERNVYLELLCKEAA